MIKKNIEELLSKQYDERIALKSLVGYYDKKLLEHLELKYIYSTWLLDTKKKLEECEIEINYLQQQLEK